MLIYLMRHGETDWNVDRRMQGRSDIPLNETGLAQARSAAAGMADIPIDRIIASPLIRTQQTAQAVAAGRGLDIETQELLIEMGFGALEGKPVKDFPECKVIFTHPDQYIPPEGGESYAELDERCRRIIDELILPLEGTCNHVLMVSHGATIKGIVRILLDRPMSRFWCDPPQGNCSCTVLSCENGTLTLVEQGRVY